MKAFSGLQWFETGRINIYVRKPANLGRAYRLLCNAFSLTGLVTDMKVLEEVLRGVRFKGASGESERHKRLPPMRITSFSKSNGITIKMEDRSHPSCVEVDATYEQGLPLLTLKEKCLTG